MLTRMKKNYGRSKRLYTVIKVEFAPNLDADSRPDVRREEKTRRKAPERLGTSQAFPEFVIYRTAEDANLIMIDND